MKNFVYLLGSHQRPDSLVVDPAWDVGAILEALKEDGRTLSGVLLTHHHDDHLNGLAELLQLYDLPIYIHRDELKLTDALTPFANALRPFVDGEVVTVGDSEVTCIKTSGHTPGSTCYLMRGRLLTGDTLFVDHCGRCDFAHSDAAEMFHSLHQVLGSLPDTTQVLPGHHYGDVPQSSLLRERQKNPYLQFSTAPDFVAFRNRKR